MKTSIEIDRLRLYGFHGVMAQEAVVGNMFEFSLSLRYPFVEAAEKDDLGATLNYAEVVSIVKTVNSVPSRLIENVAWRLKMALLERWPEIEGGSIRVSKIMPPIPSVEMAGVSVVIDW